MCGDEHTYLAQVVNNPTPNPEESETTRGSSVMFFVDDDGDPRVLMPEIEGVPVSWFPLDIITVFGSKKDTSRCTIFASVEICVVVQWRIWSVVWTTGPVIIPGQNPNCTKIIQPLWLSLGWNWFETITLAPPFNPFPLSEDEGSVGEYMGDWLESCVGLVEELADNFVEDPGDPWRVSERFADSVPKSVTKSVGPTVGIPLVEMTANAEVTLELDSVLANEDTEWPRVLC